MKYDLRISFKDYRRYKSLKAQLAQVPFASARQFWVRMNGQPVSLTRNSRPKARSRSGTHAKNPCSGR